MIRRDVIFGLIAAPFAAACDPAWAAGTAAIKALKVGEFIWRPEVSPRGPVVIVVSLPTQLVHVYRNGVAIAVSTCSTGAPGHRTPTGIFTILQKRQVHFSSTYNNAPMPNMQRLTWQGIALHAGHLPGYPASHGCIRLPEQFSRLLFSVTQNGSPVIIADQATTHSSLVHAGLLLPSDVAEDAQKAVSKADTKKTQPTADETVTSILVSGMDRKAYLMENGAVTLETPIAVLDDTQPLGTHLYSLIGPSEDGHSLKWNVFGIDGQPAEGVTVDVWSDAVLRRIDYLDRATVYRVAESLRPGTTMVITDFAAGPETRTGPDFTVIADDRKLAGRRKKTAAAID